MPDLATVEIAGGSSEFEKGKQISLGEEFDLNKFESLVLFYNSSLTLIVSKMALLLSVLAAVFMNLKF